jgi:hypothetical protein
VKRTLVLHIKHEHNVHQSAYGAVTNIEKYNKYRHVWDMEFCLEESIWETKAWIRWEFICHTTVQVFIHCSLIVEREV